MKHEKEFLKAMKLVFFCCVGTTFGTLLGQYYLYGGVRNIGAIAFGEIGAFIVLTAFFAFVEIIKSNRSISDR